MIKAVDLTEEYPCNCGVCIVTIVVRDVAKVQRVELHLSIASSGVDRKQDRPGDQASDEADDNANLEISKEDEAIK